MSRLAAPPLLLLLLAAFAVTSCKNDEPASIEKPAPSVIAEPTPPPPPKLDLSGPLPPETSAVFFSADGAITPLGCFDVRTKKLVGGRKCLALVPSDAEVLLSSAFSNDLDKVGTRKNSMCEVGDKPSSFSTARLDAGAAYDWAAWPRSLGRVVEAVSADTRGNRAKQLKPDELEAVRAQIRALRASAADGDIRPHQKASLDLDGDEKLERFISVVVAHPSDPDRYLFSGLFMAPGGDLARLRPIHTSRKPNDIVSLEGAVDLDGDGRRELWLSMAFDGGSGSALVRVGDKTSTLLAPWTCGV